MDLCSACLLKVIRKREDCRVLDNSRYDLIAARLRFERRKNCRIIGFGTPDVKMIS